jgi:hypothetical protein
MKKEYLILTVLIVALSAYLVFKKDNRQNYTLPAPVKISKGEIDKIVITRKDLSLEIALDRSKDTESWVVTDKKFAADMTAVSNMLDVARNLKISALISESRDTLRYELDDDHAIQVNAFKGKKLLLSFMVGKTAPSANHTFIMLAGDPNIYQADKSFKNNFDTTVDNLRDKKVLTFKEASIKQITLKKDGVTKILTAIPSKDEKEESAVSWKFKDGTSPDKKTLTNLLSSLSVLTCERFSDTLSKENLEKKVPFCKIILENEAPFVLNFFDEKNGDSLAATSSMSPYPFVLESYKRQDILSYVDKLAGLVKEETEKEKE